MIDEATAEQYLDAVDTAAPDEQKRMLDDLREFRDARLQQQQAQRDTYTRELYRNVDDLGGHWLPEMQTALGPWQTNPKADRAAWANTRFLANAAGISVEQAASSYDVLRDKYAYDHFKGEPKDDLSFYAAVQKDYEKGEARQAALQAIKESALASAFTDHRSGSAPSWGTHIAALKEFEADKLKGLGDIDPEHLDLQFGKEYMKARVFMEDHPELESVADVLAHEFGRGDLARPGLYAENGSGLSRAAETIANLEPEARGQFLELLSTWSKANGEKDPNGAASRLAEAFRQAGDAMVRGAGAAWGRGRMAAEGDQVNESILSDLQMGRPVLLQGDGSDLKDVVSGKEIARRNSHFGGDPFTGTFIPPTYHDERPATPKEREKLLKQAMQQRAYYQAYRQLDAIAKEEIAPIRTVLAPRSLENFGALGRFAGGTIKAAERGLLYGTAEFAPVMGASMLTSSVNPFLGAVVMADAMRGPEYNRLRLQHPEMSADDANTIATVSSWAMAGVGQLRIGAIKGGKGLLGRIPGVDRALKSLSTPTSRFWKPFLARTAVGTGEQMLDMGLMSAAPAAVQHVMHALGEDVPDVDWKAAFGDAITSPETFFGALPFALVGAGFGTWKQSRAVAEGMRSPETLQMQGVPKEKAHQIAAEAVAGRMDGAESLFREAWAARTKEDIARGVELQKQAADAAKAVQQSPEMPKLRANGDRWQIIEPDGKVSAEFESREVAQRQLDDRLLWEATGHARGVRELVDWFRNRVDPTRSAEITGKTKTVAEGMEESPLNAEALAERMRIAGIQEGADPSRLPIYGETTQELREGVYQDVVKIHNGADVMDVVEEHGHAQLNKDMREGRITREQAAEAAKVWAKETGFHLEDPENPTDTEIHEAAADMVKAHFLNERKRLPGLPASIRSFIARLRVYFKEVLGRAKTLTEMRDAGKLGKDWEGYLARSLGIDDQVVHNREVAKAVGQPLASSASYSIGKLDEPFHWRKVFGDGEDQKNRRLAARRAAEAGGRILAGLQSRYNGTPFPRTETREMAASFYGVELGIKPLYHELLGEDAPQVADALRRAASEGVVVREKDGHVYAYREDAARRVIEQNPEAYPGDSLFDKIHHASQGDYNGDLLGYGALTRDQGLALALLHDSNGELVAGFRSRPELVRDRAEMFQKMWSDLYGEEFTLDIKGEGNPSSFSIGRADYLTDMASRIDAMKRTPEERLEFAEKAKANLARAGRFRDELDRWTRLDREKDQRAAQLELDVENLRADHERQLEELQQRKAEEIARAGEANTVKFGDRIEAAGTPKEHKALERQAREMAAEIKQGIEKDFRHQETALKERFRAEERAMKEKALGVEQAAKAEVEADDRRAAMLQGLADLDAVLMALPPEVRGKIGGFTKLATLKTDKARVKFFKERMEKVEDALEKHLKEQYGEKFEKLLDRAQPKKGQNRVQKSTLGPEAQAAAAEIERLARMDEDGIAAEITGIEANIDAESDPAKLADLTQQWAWAQQFGNIEGKTSAELADAVADFDAMLKQGRSQWKFQEEARLADVKAKRGQVLAELKRPNGVTDSELAASKRRDRKTIKKVLDFVESNLDFSQTLQEAFRNGRSRMALHFSDRARLASNTYADALILRKNNFRKDMRGILGAKSLRELHVRLAALAEVRNTGVEVIEGRKTKKERVPVDVARRAVDGSAPLDFTAKERDALKQALAENDAKPENRKRDYIDLERVLNPGEKTIQEMSELEAVHYLLSWAQPDVRARMERQGWTPDAVQALRDWISPEAHKVKDWLRERYAEGYDRLNPVYRRMYGMNMPRIENYAPTYYDTAAADQGQQSGPVDTTPSRSGMAAGFIKSRVNHDAPIARVDALAAYWRHTVQSEYWIAWAETVREMRGVLGSSDVLRAIRVVDGAAREEQVKGFIKAFETNGQKEAGMLKIVEGALKNALYSNAAIALAFKVGTLMKQASAMLGSAMDLPPGAAAAGWGRFLSGQLETSLAEVWNSPTIQRRIESGYSPEVRAVLQAHGVAPSRFAALVEKGMYPVGAVDAAFTTISAAIAFDHHYREAIKAGMPEAHARAYAMDAMDRVVHRTAQPADAADKSLNEVNAGVLGKMLMLFKSEARQKFALSYLAAKRFARGEERGGNAARLAVTWMLAQAVTQTMGNIYQTIFTDKENEDIWNAEDYARAMALGHLDGVYLAGPMMSAALTWALGGKAFPSKSQNPLDQIATDIRRKEVNPSNWEDAEDIFKGVTIYLQILARTGVSEAVTGAAALTNALKDALGAGENAKKKAEGK